MGGRFPGGNFNGGNFPRTLQRIDFIIIHCIFFLFCQILLFHASFDVTFVVLFIRMLMKSKVDSRLFHRLQ